MKIKPYRVVWTIDLDATSPEVAAEMARDIQRDPASIATVFEVFEECDNDRANGVRVDLGAQ